MTVVVKAIFADYKSVMTLPCSIWCSSWYLFQQHICAVTAAATIAPTGTTAELQALFYKPVTCECLQLRL
ncbi:hypothetical protein AOV_00225 [Anaplasma ovis str. Haibei]|uniref:Uncharacterized protein n=1 Tax=Anaplasma ovis str. Haibei TaxID=1248439 RepID=A0A2Z2L7J7_9RICK|nr:hypothetical protein AOV_00225 [Anaplasma ovis str. Haibei]